MARPSLLLGLLFAACTACAQYNVPDSLQAFIQDMRAQPGSSDALAPAEDYVLVWTERCEGGPAQVTHGDGTTLKDRLAKMGDGRFLPYSTSVTYYGDRYAEVIVDQNTDLPRYTHWYFERRK